MAVSVPFLTKIVAMLVRGGVDELKKNDASLARHASISIMLVKSRCSTDLNLHGTGTLG